MPSIVWFAAATTGTTTACQSYREYCSPCLRGRVLFWRIRANLFGTFFSILVNAIPPSKKSTKNTDFCIKVRKEGFEPVPACGRDFWMQSDGCFYLPLLLFMYKFPRHQTRSKERVELYSRSLLIIYSWEEPLLTRRVVKPPSMPRTNPFRIGFQFLYRISYRKAYWVTVAVSKVLNI